MSRQVPLDAVNIAERSELIDLALVGPERDTKPRDVPSNQPQGALPAVTWIPKP
jgi:hypothetical protein